MWSPADKRLIANVMFGGDVRLLHIEKYLLVHALVDNRTGYPPTAEMPTEKFIPLPTSTFYIFRALQSRGEKLSKLTFGNFGARFFSHNFVTVEQSLQ